MLQLFAPFTFSLDKNSNLGIQINQAEAEECIIDSILFYDTENTLLVDDGVMFNKNIDRIESILMKIESSNCDGKDIAILINSGGFVSDREFLSLKYKIDADDFYFNLKTGEKTCLGKSCDSVKFLLQIYQGTTVEKVVKVEDFENKILKYQCLGRENSLPSCNNGSGDYTWNINNSSLSPTDMSSVLENAWHYSYTTLFLQTGLTQTLRSNDFENEAVCNVDLNRKMSQLIPNQNLSYSFTPCEQYNEQTTTSTELYFFEIFNPNGEKLSESIHNTNSLCIEARNDFLENDENENFTVSDCQTKTIVQNTTPFSDNSRDVVEETGLPACSMLPWGSGTVMGCVAQGFYYILFKPTSFIFALSGKILDFTFFYSIKDTSYRSEFVVQGWKIVKDFCNMFFIFILLYIAFGTILNLNGVKTKEMIINVVIIGLLINFSLFATHLIIDASNILARVFYNQKTIAIVTKNQDTNQAKNETGDYGEIKLSEAIIQGVNPVKLITQADRVGKIPTKSDGVNEDNAEKDALSTGTFILVVILAAAVNIVGTIAFLSTALIFIGRVLMLWLAMIFAPLAFFSYIVPAMQDWKMVGWKNWWSDTLKMAFVAPVFAFFMYLIVSFLGTGLGIISSDANSFSLFSGNEARASSLSFLIGIIVPFVFVMILLMKAKDIAVKMSGEIGAALSKAGAAVAGVGLAAATGGAALAMRGTVGRLGNKMATSKFAKDTWVGRNVTGKVGKGLASSSFDVRATKLGGMAAKGLGVESNIGKAKQGGYEKHLSDKVKRKQKRAKELEVSENEPLKQDLNREERALEAVTARSSSQIEYLDGEIKGATEASAAAAVLVGATDRNDPQFETRQNAARDAAQRVIDLRAERSNVKNAVGFARDENGNMIDQSHNTDNGLISTDAVSHAIDEANRTQTEATAAEAAIITATTNMAAAIAAAQAAETTALNAATTAANTAIANATPENLAASAAARAAAVAATANIATVRTASAADVAAATAAATAARAVADNAGALAATYVTDAHENGTGRSMNNISDHAIPEAKNAITNRNRDRKTNYARRQARWGGRANREAEHKIIMDTKIETD